MSSFMEDESEMLITRYTAFLLQTSKKTAVVNPTCLHDIRRKIRNDLRAREKRKASAIFEMKPARVDEKSSALRLLLQSSWAYLSSRFRITMVTTVKEETVNEKRAIYLVNAGKVSSPGDTRTIAPPGGFSVDYEYFTGSQQNNGKGKRGP
ncbi:hypothetical protein LSTR_LSTR013729 [Laodelphax striatellus]|uniref:Uncharacterized protein n=1 Tax=Laodelphax striatellus TaxID=195883 RepID=A0A482WW27_LAOST|nr:hypothetical protein LSTR_LSTR013729 [Laodelphax striatellus]